MEPVIGQELTSLLYIRGIYAFIYSQLTSPRSARLSSVDGLKNCNLMEILPIALVRLMTNCNASYSCELRPSLIKPVFSLIVQNQKNREDARQKIATESHGQDRINIIRHR